MGIHVLAIYRPKDGKAADLETEVITHVPTLRDLGTLAELPNATTMFPEFEFIGSY